MEDLITGNDQTFDASLGSWTNSGGTMTRDTGYQMLGQTASLKFVVTTSAQYVEVPISGTFTSGTDYWSVLFLSAEDTTGTKNLKIDFGLIGTDAAQRTGSLNMGTIYPYVGNANFIAIGLRWRPTADRTGVKLRFTMNNATTATWHIGMARAFAATELGSINVSTLTYFPVTGPNLVGNFSPFGHDGLQIFKDGAAGLHNSSVTAGIDFSDGGFPGNYLWAENTPGDLADSGHNIQVGIDYIGLYISEKDSSTIQAYPDVSGGYDIELKDRGSGKFWYAVNTAGNRVPLSSLMNGGMDIVLGSGTGVIPTGVAVYALELPCAGVWTSNRLLADQSGSMTVTIKKSTYSGYAGSLTSIVASAKPTLSSAIKSEDTTLTGWTTTFAAGDILRVEVDTATTVTMATLSLRFRRT